MAKYNNLIARNMRESDLGYVLSWRNDPSTRRAMLSQHEITDAEHRSWFNRALLDKTHVPLVIEENGEPCGCVIFSNVQNNSISEWSFYSAPKNRGGYGTKICSAALDHIFLKFGVYKVAGYVLAFNNASIRLHKHLGFIQEGVIKEHSLIDGVLYDLILFSILSTDWRSGKIKPHITSSQY